MRKHYVGMDVHQASTSIAVMKGQGKLISGSLIETKAQTIIDFLKGLSGEVEVTFEEGTQAAWLYDLIHPPRQRADRLQSETQQTAGVGQQE